MTDPIQQAIDALLDAKQEYWDDNHSYMSEGDFENHYLIMDIDKAVKALRTIQKTHVLVPGEPTWGMLRGIKYGADLKSGYASMIAAAKEEKND